MPAPSRPADDPAFWINVTELSALTGLSRRQLGRFEEQGLHRQKQRHYYLGDVLKWALNIDFKGDLPDLAEAKRDLALSQRKKLDLEIERLQGALLPYEEVSIAFLDLANRLVTGLNALPPRLAPVVAGIKDRAKCEAEIERECEHIREGLAEAAREFEEPGTPSPGTGQATAKD